MIERQEQQQTGDRPEAQDAIVPNTMNEPAVLPHGELLPFGTERGHDITEQMSSGAFLASTLTLHKWLILLIALIIAGISIPAIWLGITPLYQATAVVRVSPVISRIVFRNEENGRLPFYSAHLNTQVSILRSPIMLQRVLDLEKVNKTQWYQEQPRSFLRAPLSHLERLSQSLMVRPRKNTELIEVTMLAKVAADSKTVADAVMEEFIKFNKESLRKTDIHRFETLDREYTAVQKEVDGLIETKINISKRLGTVGPEQLRSQLATHLSVLEAEYEKMKRAYAMTQWELDTKLAETEGKKADMSDEEENKDNDEAVLVYATDVEWRRLHIDLQKARHILKLARQQFGELHPRIKQLSSSVEYAQQLLHDREIQLESQGPETALQMASGVDGNMNLINVKNLKRMIRRQERAMQLLADEITGQRIKVTEAGDIAQELAHYTQEISHKQDLYETLRRRRQELMLEGKAPARISAASHALKPSRPRRDRRIFLSIIALVGAMVTGFGVAYLKSSMNPKIFAPDDVQHAIRVPFLGQLPPLPTTPDLSAADDPLLIESMRMVRTALLRRLAGTKKKVVLITSSSSQAGKSTVAVLLAQSLARLGKRTLLIEGDLRNPSVSQRLFQYESKVGLSALLAGVANDEDAILPTNTPKFDLLPAGHQPDNFSFEMLANGVFSECLARWRKTYDIVLLDSPPVLPVADARILAGHADGTLMVLRSFHCRRAEVMQAYADLCATGGALLGTVLVGVQPGGYYGYGYGYGRDYKAYIGTSSS